MMDLNDYKNKHAEYCQYISSTFGILKIQANDIGITHITFSQNKNQTERPNSHTQQAATQLSEFFAGKRCQFDLSLCPIGTAFQQQVWQQLLTIPYGKTQSYADIANHIDNPKAVRAVGAANGRNPIAIVIPCHRIIGSNGSLTGYAWGTDVKEQLLALEESVSAG